MYVLTLADGSPLTMDLCVAIALLGHPAGTTQLSEMSTLAGPQPDLVLLDWGRAEDHAAAVQYIRHFHPGVWIGVVRPEGGSVQVDKEPKVVCLSRPVQGAELRELIRLAGSSRSEADRGPVSVTTPVPAQVQMI